MDLKELIGFVTVIIALVIYALYYRSVFQGKTKPHLYTYLIGSIVSGIAFTGSFISGGAAGAWGTGISGLLAFGVFLLALKYGTKDVKKIDAFCLAAAFIALIPWVLTKNPTISVILIAFVDSASILPTMRKSWNDPGSEPGILWGINALKHGLAIFAVSSVSIATVFYPLAMVFMNGLLALEIAFRHRKKN
jgi:hypothetical protein